MKVYLASPLGFSESGVSFIEHQLIPIFHRCEVTLINPFQLTSEEIINEAVKLPYGLEKKEEWQKINPIIGRNNLEAIKSCDLLFAVLDGTDVDSGTAAEIGYATAISKPVIGYRGDFRLSADNEGAKINLQVEYFIHLNGGFIIHKISDIESALKKINSI